MKKLFGDINLTWKKLIIFAVLAGIYTAIMAILPITKDTSFRDISMTFEVWVFFGILIIINSKSNKDSALKCFIFFLISQPLVYLLQVPFSYMGWNLFGYYKYWFIWTLFTIPMGYIGYYLKNNKWYGILILLPMLILVGYEYSAFIGEAIFFFPNHLLSSLFCIITMIMYSLYIFKNKSLKIITLIITIVILMTITIVSIFNRPVYNTSFSIKDITLDNTYKVYLKDSKYGELSIKYDDDLEEYIVDAKFTKTGDTKIILKHPNGDTTSYKITIERTSYQINYE